MTRSISFVNHQFNRGDMWLYPYLTKWHQKSDQHSCMILWSSDTQLCHSWKIGQFNLFLSKVAVCSSEDLDCVESIKIDSNDCIERCDGIIVDAYKQNKQKDYSKIQNLLKDYENYKFPNNTDVPFPSSLKSKNWKSWICKKLSCL